MELHLRWIGGMPLAALESVMEALAPAARARLARHPGGPRSGRNWIEGHLHAGSARPAWLPELLAVAFERGDDMVVVPGDWRPLRPRWACFDGDMTLVDAETIDVLGELADCGHRVAEVTRRAMAGELDFSEALRARLGLLAGLPESALMVARERIALMPGATTLLGALHASGCRSAVFSGGFHFLLDPIAKAHGISRVRAHELELHDGSLTGRIVGSIVDAAAKAAALRELVSAEEALPRDVLAVGDGANDGPMLEAAGIGLAFHPKPALLAKACGVVSERDLSRLPALLDL